jgi:hypothetical protein
LLSRSRKFSNVAGQFKNYEALRRKPCWISAEFKRIASLFNELGETL